MESMSEQAESEALRERFTGAILKYRKLALELAAEDAQAAKKLNDSLVEALAVTCKAAAVYATGSIDFKEFKGYVERIMAELEVLAGEAVLADAVAEKPVYSVNIFHTGVC